MVRDCVKENSLENISPDHVQMTLPTLGTQASSFDSKSEDREEIADTSAPALGISIPKEQGTYTPGS